MKNISKNFWKKVESSIIPYRISIICPNILFKSHQEQEGSEPRMYQAKIQWVGTQEIQMTNRLNLYYMLDTVLSTFNIKTLNSYNPIFIGEEMKLKFWGNLSHSNR